MRRARRPPGPPGPTTPAKPTKVGALPHHDTLPRPALWYYDPVGLPLPSARFHAHDHCKADLVEWAEYNRHALAAHRLIATGTTGTILEHELGLAVERLRSGPLGGDLQIGARIAEGDIDALVFFWTLWSPNPTTPT